jgi:hypothetical protein
VFIKDEGKSLEAQKLSPSGFPLIKWDCLGFVPVYR